MNGKTFEVRVREMVVPPCPTYPRGKYVKKSKFYRAKNSQDAAQKYNGSGRVMWANKVSTERRLGVREYRLDSQGEILERPAGFGAFLRLGDDLMREIRQQEQQDMQRAKEELSK